MINKKAARHRRGKKTKFKIKGPRLIVNRTNRHIYATAIDDVNARVIATVSTLEKALAGSLSGSKVEKAKVVGKTMAERLKKAGIEIISFDRRGFKYHGCVKAIADAARENGLKI